MLDWQFRQLHSQRRDPMKKLTSLALTLIVPVVTFGLGSVSAAEKDTTTETYKSSKPATALPAAGQGMTTANYHSSKPANAFYADDLIGVNVKSRVGEKDIGEINDLIIDKDGQVVAAIVDVGGFLGIAQKSVAIDWKAVERTVDKDGKHVLHVNATEQTLKDTPEYQRD
jgi:sporulation protein YlmC with PRC-barrel domain